MQHPQSLPTKIPDYPHCNQQQLQKLVKYSCNIIVKREGYKRSKDCISYLHIPPSLPQWCSKYIHVEPLGRCLCVLGPCSLQAWFHWRRTLPRSKWCRGCAEECCCCSLRTTPCLKSAHLCIRIKETATPMVVSGASGAETRESTLGLLCKP